MESKRFNNVSIYRIIATICVLQFHIFYILYDRAIPYEMLLSKGVQGLTALSGFLYSQKIMNDNKLFIKNNFKKILIPAFLCLLLMFVWNFVYMFISGNYDYISLFFDHRAYGGGLLVQPGNYYYILYIMICYLITPLLINNKYNKIIIPLVILIELIIGFIFGPAIIASSYVIGYLIGKRHYDTYTKKNRKKSFLHFVTWIVIFLVSLIVYIYSNEMVINNLYITNHIKSLILNITSCIIGISSLFILLIVFKFTNNFQRLKFFKFTDNISIYVYLLNQAFMCGAMNVTNYTPNFNLKILLVYIFTITAAIILYYINKFIYKNKTTNL